ncbi:hypothetical protein SKAU_G00397980 [Synaphobranchus kaupii]|uniref:Uncharacterized protein n=1 Tax=Synaphobranchus kaupii TaxID=118154 RepID=A0A9Q1E8H4_SYNKA|nr:hypothetical protein SKAU_G00397980 [Synaphobranchus kaupii]
MNYRDDLRINGNGGGPEKTRDSPRRGVSRCHGTVRRGVFGFKIELEHGRSRKTPVVYAPSLHGGGRSVAARKSECSAQRSQIHNSCDVSGGRMRQVAARRFVTRSPGRGS